MSIALWRRAHARHGRRNPTATSLYPIVLHHLETFLAHAAEAEPLGDGVSYSVENDFRAYLRCGILAHGPGPSSPGRCSISAE